MDSPRKYLQIKSTVKARPRWPEIAAEAINLRETHDIKVRNLSDYFPLRRAILRAGFFLWRHHLEKNVWVIRISDEPTEKKENPLSRELTRTYRTTKFRSTPYGRWLRLTDQLMKGQSINFKKRSDVTIMKAKLRQHKPSPPYPPYQMVITPNPETASWDVSLKMSAGSTAD